MDEVDLGWPYALVMGRGLFSLKNRTLMGAYLRVCQDVDAYRFGILRLKNMVHWYMWGMASRHMQEEP